jgi:hypothetical protein
VAGGQAMRAAGGQAIRAAVCACGCLWQYILDLIAVQEGNLKSLSKHIRDWRIDVSRTAQGILRQCRTQANAERNVSFVHTNEGGRGSPTAVQIAVNGEEDSEAQYWDATQKRKNNRQMASKRRLA